MTLQSWVRGHWCARQLRLQNSRMPAIFGFADPTSDPMRPRRSPATRQTVSAASPTRKPDASIHAPCAVPTG